jgi:hypothetical protein
MKNDFENLLFLGRSLLFLISRLGLSAAATSASASCHM